MPVLKSNAQHVIRRIQPGLWQIVFRFPASTNCWLWKENDGLTLIDAGFPWSAKAILAAIDCAGEPLKRIVITHAHPDHAGAAAEISSKTGAVVMAHSEDIPYLQGRSMAEVPGFLPCRAVLQIGRYFGILNAPPIARVQPLAGGESVGTLKVLHTPGHTPGSISLWAEKEKAVFCGDNICTSFHFLHVGMLWFTLDLMAQKASLASYVDLPAQLLLSGHGAVYRGDVAHRVRRLLAA